MSPPTDFCRRCHGPATGYACPVCWSEITRFAHSLRAQAGDLPPVVKHVKPRPAKEPTKVARARKVQAPRKRTRPVRTGPTRLEIAAARKAAAAQFAETLGRTPSINELMAHLDAPRHVAVYARNAIKYRSVA